MGLDGIIIETEQDEKSSLAKDQLVSANWWGNTSTFMLGQTYTQDSTSECIIRKLKPLSTEQIVFIRKQFSRPSVDNSLSEKCILEGDGRNYLTRNYNRY